jgi:hypothetical protein
MTTPSHTAYLVHRGEWPSQSELVEDRHRVFRTRTELGLMSYSTPLPYNELTEARREVREMLRAGEDVERRSIA